MFFLLDTSFLLEFLADLLRGFSPHLGGLRILISDPLGALAGEMALTTTEMFWCLTSTVVGMRFESVTCFLKRMKAFRARLIWPGGCCAPLALNREQRRHLPCEHDSSSPSVAEHPDHPHSPDRHTLPYRTRSRSSYLY